MDDVSIPIWKGFSIQIKGNCAVHKGCPESEVVDDIERWLSRHEPKDEKYALVEKWLQLKRGQNEVDANVQAERAQRERINASVDKALKENRPRLSEELAELARNETFKAKGIPRREE